MPSMRIVGTIALPGEGHERVRREQQLQEAITLLAFGAFSTFVLKEKLRVQELVAFALILAAVVIAMSGRTPAAHG